MINQEQNNNLYQYGNPANNAPLNPQALLSVRGISKNFKSTNVLKNINLDVYPGEIYGIVGPNGCGKTTLFKILLSIFNASSGEGCLMGGHTNFNNNLDESYRVNLNQVGFYIEQNFDINKNARQNLKNYSLIKGIKDNDQEIDQLISMVGLQPNLLVKSYSLGMRQRLGLACAFLGNPRLIILDEPANGLDPQAIESTHQIIKFYNQNYGTTFIVSSHYLESLQQMGTRFGIIKNGEIVQEISKESLRSTKTYKLSLTEEQLAAIKDQLIALGIDINNIEIVEEKISDIYNQVI